MDSPNIDGGDMLSEQNVERVARLSSGRKQILPPINFHEDRKMMKDCLPQNLLATLTQACSTFDDLGPKSKSKMRSTSRRTDNVWHHKKTREKLKHLTEQPPCHCGAGSDISYLLDAAAEKSEKKLEIAKDDPSSKLIKNMVPESIIPSEFHVVKHKGAVSLEVHDEKYTTQADTHEEHQTVFPSMKPSGRQEALQLMQTMNKLLKKAGVSEKPDANETLGNDDSSQIEKLLNLVKEEQTIYNIIFSEVIRQVSVECIERGTVLAELRKRYAKLLESVPKQVKSLHEEVLAQRALDRRLTEELSSFKAAITLLTKELHEIHAHDEEVTKQAVETQAELNEALKESEKNASLLAEYHDLYELQRRRLDYQLTKLIEERDLWAGSAHMLSLKVTEKHNLVTVRRLHLFEKAWYKLANNFAILLGHEDEKQLQILAGHVHRWQEITDSFNEKLFIAERASSEKIQAIESSIALWAKKFERVVTPDEGTVHPPEEEYIQALFSDMKSWEDVFNKECERFMGDVLLSCEDDLLQLNKCVDLWIQTAVNIFRNHPSTDGCNHPQHVQMMELNSKVTKLHSDFKLRMSGENGVSKIFIQILNNLDTWINKVNTILNGGETLYDSEWLLLADLFQVQWKDALHDAIKLLSCGDEDESDNADEKSEIVDDWLKDKSDVGEVYEATQKWLSDTTSAIENEDSDIVEQVANTHSNMVRWTITVLLRIAPDTEAIDQPNGVIEEDSSAGLGAAILEESTSESIINRAILLFNWLRCLTDRIVACIKGVVTLTRTQKSNEVDSTLEDLQKIENECVGWMNTANLLISEVTGETIPMKDFLPLHTSLEQSSIQKIPTTQDDTKLAQIKSNILPSGDEEVINLEGDLADVEEVDPVEEHIDMHVIGHDENVKKRRMVSPADEDPDVIAASMNREGSAKRSATLEDLQTMELLQKQLIETETRAQGAEGRAFLAESALKEAEEKIRSLERAIDKMEDGVQEGVQVLDSDLHVASSSTPIITTDTSNDADEVISENVSANREDVSNFPTEDGFTTEEPVNGDGKVGDVALDVPEKVPVDIDQESIAASSLCSISPTLLPSTQS